LPKKVACIGISGPVGYDWSAGSSIAIKRLVGESNPNFAIDNHTGQIHIGRQITLRADAGIAEYVLADMNIAASLGLPGLDVISNTPMVKTLTRLGYFDGNEIDQWKIQAATLIAPVRRVNYWGQEGAYHESLEDLRNHPRIKEFREYLRDAEILTRTQRNLVGRTGFESVTSCVSGKPMRVRT
jgi:hypothetical protein